LRTMPMAIRPETELDWSLAFGSFMGE
jgi:hypothetical protein